MASMQEAKCPNCEKDIRVLSAGDMDEEYGITPNVLQHARETGNFPDPWLSFGNRAVYLADEIEAYAEARARAKTQKTIDELKSLLDALPERERTQAIKSIQHNGDHVRTSRQRSKS